MSQINGRNAISWEEKFDYDIKYINKITFVADMKIIFKTIKNVLERNGISQEGKATTDYFKGNE